MISITSGNAITFAEAARLLPRDSRGRQVSRITLKRWAIKGANGAILEAARMGHAWYTTREALDAFTAAQARARSPVKQAAHSSARAEAECQQLERMGL